MPYRIFLGAHSSRERNSRTGRYLWKSSAASLSSRKSRESPLVAGGGAQAMNSRVAFEGCFSDQPD
jgi:hypothetical protein